jgi:hypothetical protein
MKHLEVKERVLHYNMALTTAGCDIVAGVNRPSNAQEQEI